MTLRERLLAAIKWLEANGPAFAALLAFAESLLSAMPVANQAKASHQCCDDPCACCDAVDVALVEAMVANAMCRACCAKTPPMKPA